MAIKYVRIIATGPSMKVTDGQVQATASSPIVNARGDIPVIGIENSDLNVNVQITGLPPENRYPNEPLFKYIGDEFQLVTNFKISFAKSINDIVSNVERFSILDGMPQIDAVGVTDDFDGTASTEDDQTASFSKLTIEMLSADEYCSLGLSKGTFLESVSEQDSYFLSPGKNIADVLGDTVERMIFDLSYNLIDNPSTDQIFSLGPNKVIGDVANRVDSLSFGYGPTLTEDTSIGETALLRPEPVFVEGISDVEEVATAVGKGLVDVPIDTEVVSKGIAKNPGDSVGKIEAGILLMQSYYSQDYWFDDYNGIKTTF